ILLWATAIAPEPGTHISIAPSDLVRAVTIGRASLIDLCLIEHVNPNGRDAQGRTPLLIAASQRDWKTAQRLIDAGALVDLADKNGFTPLMATAMRGNLAMFRSLLAHSVDLHAEAPCRDGRDLLGMAIDGGNSEIVNSVTERLPVMPQWTTSTRSLERCHITSTFNKHLGSRSSTSFSRLWPAQRDALEVAGFPQLRLLKEMLKSDDAAIQAAARALRTARRVVVATGAGMSQESGIPTFRDAVTGLWARYDPEELATEAAFRRHPARVFGWYAWRRRLVRAAVPHPGYHALVALAGLVPELTIVTQNVDGLHTRVGSRQVLELHGSLE